ncbi:MAG: toxin-antitoxin system HicB family antitoxin [Clostridiales bacterium]|nr:toxin-antitoxin system HicB family antitoxin [Clostridiales bacterium]
MAKKLTPEEIARRMAQIDSLPAEQPTEEDLAAFAKADAEDVSETISLEEFKTMHEYSGNLMLRIPKELHKSLAEAAKANGVSLNQYAMYKLAKQ